MVHTHTQIIEQSLLPFLSQTLLMFQTILTPIIQRLHPTINHLTRTLPNMASSATPLHSLRLHISASLNYLKYTLLSQQENYMTQATYIATSTPPHTTLPDLPHTLNTITQHFTARLLTGLQALRAAMLSLPIPPPPFNPPSTSPPQNPPLPTSQTLPSNLPPPPPPTLTTSPPHPPTSHLPPVSSTGRVSVRSSPNPSDARRAKARTGKHKASTRGACCNGHCQARLPYNAPICTQCYAIPLDLTDI